MSHVCTFFLGGNFFFKVSTLPKPLAADLVPWQLCAAHRACEQLVRQCLGFPTRSNDDSTSPSRHHDITTLLLALKLRQNWAAASRLVVGGGWVDRVGIFSWIFFWGPIHGCQASILQNPTLQQFRHDLGVNRFQLVTVSRAQVEGAESWLETSRSNKEVAYVETDVSGGPNLTLFILETYHFPSFVA